MSLVRIRPGEPIERALRVLKKKVDKEGTLKVLKARRYYEKPSLRKKLKAKAALRNKKMSMKSSNSS